MNSWQRAPSGGAAAMMLFVGSLAGCGSSNSVPIDKFLTEYYSAFCAMEVRCQWVSDQAYCMSLAAPRMKSALAGDLAADIAAAKAGKTRYDGNRARACLDSFARASCDSYLGAIESSGSTYQGIFSGGTTLSGEPCISQSECQVGSFCEINATDYCTGICTPTTNCAYGPPCSNGQVCDPNQSACVDPVPPGAAGERCGNQTPDCQPGLYCAFSMPFDICTPLSYEGQSCGDAIGCGGGSICTPAESTSNVGLCRKVARKGEPCQAVNQCGGFLASSITCDMNMQVCVDNTSNGACSPRNPVAASGCNPFVSFCDPSALTCKPIAAIGDPCTVNGPECGWWTNCQQDPNDATGTKGLCAPYPVCAR